MSISSNEEQQVLGLVYEILSEEDGWTMSASELTLRLKGYGPREVLKGQHLIRFLLRYPNHFELFDQHLIKAKTALGLCSKHCVNAGSCDGGPGCSGLHICKFYLRHGNCKYKSTCEYGHDLKTQHNKSQLKKNFLHFVPISELKSYFRQTDISEITPVAICRFYNSKQGCGNNTRYDEGISEGCPFLHICKFYVYGSCNFSADKCRHSHNMKNRQVATVLEKHGIKTQRSETAILTDLREMFKFETKMPGRSQSYDSLFKQDSSPFFRNANEISSRKGRSRGSQPTKNVVPFHPNTPEGYPKMMRHLSVDRVTGARPKTYQMKAAYQEKERFQTEDVCTDICLYSLRGNCRFGIHCCKHHKSLTYQWQYRSAIDTIEWTDFSEEENTEVETMFCNPEKGTHSIVMSLGTTFKLDFVLMKITDDRFNLLEIRRLSTISSVLASHDPLSTIWKWYWLSDDKKWLEYGEEDSAQNKSNVDVSALEQKYQETPKTHMAFSAGKHKYVLDFNVMVQENLKIGTKRQVRRRPILFSKELVEKKKKEKMSGNLVSQKRTLGVSVPSIWKTDAPFTTYDQLLEHFSIVQVDKDSEEFKAIQSQFDNSLLRQTTIKSVKRIQNGDLWISFSRERDKMKLKLKLLEEEFIAKGKEKQLFHGTDHAHMNAICHQGFDFRLSGTSSGTRFGKGSYFATDARYSRNYASRNEMFLAKVLVGEYVRGHQTYVRPPEKRSHELYDCCVNDESNPEIFVIFDMYRTYPEYIIEY